MGSDTPYTRVIFYLNDNLVELTGLQNAADDSYVNDATITLDLHVKSDDSAVTGATGVTLSYVAASNGDYRGIIPDTADIDRSEQYVAKITADAGAGLAGYWEILVQSQVRTG